MLTSLPLLYNYLISPMKIKLVKILILLVVSLVSFTSLALAVGDNLSPWETPQPTEIAEPATPAAETKKPDLTQPTQEVKGKLEGYLAEQILTPLSWHNFLKHAIHRAVSSGVPANTIVLLLLLPLVAGVIAATRHLVGFRGFGILIPATISVVFVATGIITGILIFLAILVVATVGRMIIRRLKLQYLPRMALLLWFVTLGVLASLSLSPYLGLKELTTISIFPILIMVLLAETFIEVQIGKSLREATGLTTETLIVAFIGYLILSFDALQKTVLLNPEAVVLAVAIFDIFLGRYTGLRFFEYFKFHEATKGR